MTIDITNDQKELLVKCVTTNDTPESSADLTALQEKGLIWIDGKTVTDRGMALAIVKCNIPYSEVIKTKHVLDNYTRKERQMLSKIFTTQSEFDQLFYAKFKVMLDWDMFTENNAFDTPRGDDGYKMTNIVMKELAQNSTIAIPTLLKYMRIPNLGSIIRTREDLIKILEQAKHAAGY